MNKTFRKKTTMVVTVSELIIKLIIELETNRGTRLTRQSTACVPIT